MSETLPIILCGYKHEKVRDSMALGETIESVEIILDAIGKCPARESGKNPLCAHFSADGNVFHNYKTIIEEAIEGIDDDSSRERAKIHFQLLQRNTLRLDQFARLSHGGYSQEEIFCEKSIVEIENIVQQLKEILEKNDLSFGGTYKIKKSSLGGEDRVNFDKLIDQAQEILKKEYLSFLPTIGIEIESN